MLSVLVLFLSVSNPVSPLLMQPQLSDPIAITPEIEAFLDESIDPRQEPLVKLQQLVSVVFQENRLGFTYMPVTKTAIQTFEERSGNCLSYTNLLIGMARYLGFDARFREVEIAPIWSMQGNILVLSRHMNVLVRIGSQSYVIDLFPEVFRIQLEGHVVSDERGLAHYYNNLGAFHLSHGRPRRALAFYRQAVRSDPTAAFAWTNMGVAYSQIGEKRSAVECYQKALGLDEKDLVTLSNLALAYRRNGQYREAGGLEKKVAKFRDQNPFYHFALGEDAYRVGDVEGAIEHFKDALKRDSHEHHILFALAKAYLAQQRYPEARAYLEAAQRYAVSEMERGRYTRKLELLAAALQ